MSSDGVQITIPTLEDDDFSIDSIPFGRSKAFGTSGFGFSGSSSGSGFGTPTGGHGFGAGFTFEESPTHTPTGEFDKSERSYFHARGDSVTSDGSVHSGGHSFKSGPGSVKSNKSYIPTIPGTPALLAHSSNGSTATSQSFTSRKSSLASIRNAFKPKGNETPPPLPFIEQQQQYPSRSTMPRSNSSLSHIIMNNAPSPRRPSVNAGNGSPQARPPTPSRPATPSAGTVRHIPKRSVSLSRNGFDPGSEHYPSQSSPPPVPKMPDEYMGNSREHLRTPSLTDSEEPNPNVKEPRTPAEYALHAVFTRFVVSADHKVDQFLKAPLTQESVYLPMFIGPGVDASFDSLLDSLARIAQKQLKRVVESILRWRSDQNKRMDQSLLRLHLNGSPSSGRSLRLQDPSIALRERKALISTYIACRALIIVFSSITKDHLGSNLGSNLEDITFEQLRRSDSKVVPPGTNHRANVEIAAQLIGHLSNIRFESVTDKFLAQLKPIAAGAITRDGDLTFENLVQGLRYVQIKVWPPEAFDEGAEFLFSVSKAFEKAHGFRLKKIFAESLTCILHSIGKSAQHEVNHPVWAKAIETILPKAQDMMSKTRYWHAAYPLVATGLCVAPQDFFLKHWVPFFEGGLNKLKEKAARSFVLNGMLRLLWTYLYRCQESTSTTHSRLDSLLRHFFPLNRLNVYPSDDAGVVLLHMMHFVISRHFEYGCDYALGLMQESTLTPGKQRVISIEALAPERTMIGFRAILLSLTCMEKDKRIPAWPSSWDFSVFDNSGANWPLSGQRLPDSLLSKGSIQPFLDRLKSIVISISRVLSQTVGGMSIFDDKWLYRPQLLMEDIEPHLVRQHPECKVAYPRSALPQIDLLITLFDSWPRCLSDKSPTLDTIELLFRGLVHVEPDVTDSASRCLLRFAEDPNRVTDVLDNFNRFLFGPFSILNEGTGTRLYVESASLLRLWASVIDTWVQRIANTSETEYSGPTPWMVGARKAFFNAQAGALFLLTFERQSTRKIGVKVLRQVANVSGRLHRASLDSSAEALSRPKPLDIVEILKGHAMAGSLLEDRTQSLTESDRQQLLDLHNEHPTDALLYLAEAEKQVDRRLWMFVFPTFIRLTMDHHPYAIDTWRETVNSAVLRYHHLISSLAGISSRPVTHHQASRTGTPGYNAAQEKEKFLIEFSSSIAQWQFWIRGLCAAAIAPDTRPVPERQHARAMSDLSTQRERMSSARGLFRHLTAFLASEHHVFRDAIVSAFGAIQQGVFLTLLDDLQPMTRHILDGRSKIVQRGQGQEHLYASVAHIYQLTAHFVHDPRSLGDHSSLIPLLHFIRETRIFLIRPDNRRDSELNPLRRYFCGLVEHVFDRLNTLKEPGDRFISKNIRLALYRLCEEWCQFRPPVDKQRRDVPQIVDARTRAEEEELDSLVGAAYGAMAALCQGAFFLSNEPSSDSPTDIDLPEHMEPLNADILLERIIDMLASKSVSVNNSGRKALTSLLKHPYPHEALTDATVRWSYVTPSHDAKSLFFNVVVGVIRTFPGHHFNFGQIACLALCNLSYPAREVRKNAYILLEELNRQFEGRNSLTPYEAAIGSDASTVYLNAQRRLSYLLAEEHHSQGGAVLAQCAMRLPQVYDNMSHSMHGQILQFLEPWVSTLDLMPEGYSQPSPDGYRALCNLYSLTFSYVDRYPDHIQSLWGRLVHERYPMNSSATVRFLIEQAARRGSFRFITYASRVIACLSRTTVGCRTFEDLCSLIDAAGMSQGTEPDTAASEEFRGQFRADLAALTPSEQPRLCLGTGQLAMLFLADTTLDRSWALGSQLPCLLHVLFTHFDHRLAYVEQVSRRMLFQLLRSWMPGYDELSERSKYPANTVLKDSVKRLEAAGPSLFWTESNSFSDINNRLCHLCNEIMTLLEPLHPQLRQEWGDVALSWVTSCASRPIAVRSLQLFRVLMPRVNRNTLAGLLARLSNTIADPDESIQAFTNELLLTLTALARSKDLDLAVLPQYFWSTYACLSTTVEAEYAHALEIMDALLNYLNLSDNTTVKDLLECKPTNWAGPGLGLQCLVIKGLRSSVTGPASFKLLCRLAGFGDNILLEPGDGRLRDLFTVSLPWCLNAMDVDVAQPVVVDLGEKIAHLAESANLPNLARIMVSFSKSRFRTKDDFLRQSVTCLREHFAPKHWQDVTTLLLSLILNSERWLRLKSMQVLKGLFSHRESRQPLELLGSELLMPLLRLLQTDLAPQALDVLDEQVTIVGGGGPKATQILRMSMRISVQLNTFKAGPVGAIFGAPTETGWCIPDPKAAMQQTRTNVLLTYDMCRMPRPSLLIFQPEPAITLPQQYDDETPEDDFGDLLGKLGALNTYFKEQGTVEPSEEALQRAQAILSKSSSTSGHAGTVPETPLADHLFEVMSSSPIEYNFGDSDEEESGEDIEAEGPGSDLDDSFAFDRSSRFYGRLRP